MNHHDQHVWMLKDATTALFIPFKHVLGAYRYLVFDGCVVYNILNYWKFQPTYVVQCDMTTQITLQELASQMNNNGPS